MPSSDDPCIVLGHTDLLEDLIGASVWDPLQTPLKLGVRFPGSALRPDKAPPRRSKSKKRAQRRAATKPNHPDGHNLFAPGPSRGSVSGPPGTFLDCCQRPDSDSAAEDEDPSFADRVRGRPRSEAPCPPLSLSLPVNDHRQACGCCDTCGFRCGKGGGQSESKGRGGPPWSSLWASVDEEQEDAK